MHQLKLKSNTLHIAHQSELVDLKRQLAMLQDRIKELDQYILDEKTNTKISHKISIPTDDGMVFISALDIMYCQAAGNYTYIHTKSKNFFISKTLKSVICMVNSDQFIRCHQSYFVNKNEITGIKNSNGMNIILFNEEEIPVSRRNKKLVWGHVKKISN